MIKIKGIQLQIRVAIKLPIEQQLDIISTIKVAADALLGPSEAIMCSRNDPEPRDRTRCREILVKVRKGIVSYPKAY